MKITWEDRKNRGTVDKQSIRTKPTFSFEYAWFNVTDDTAEYVESHEYGNWNKDMTAEQKAEVVDYYTNIFPRTIVRPTLTNIEKAVEDGVEMIDGLSHRKWKIEPKFDTQDEEDEFLAEVAVQDAIKEVKSVEDAVSNLIQDEINIYNADNGVVFKNINAIQKYTRNSNYTHYAFCTSVLDWNEIVWETVRTIQMDIAIGNRTKSTLEEIIAELPVRI